VIVIVLLGFLYQKQSKKEKRNVYNNVSGIPSKCSDMVNLVKNKPSKEPGVGPMVEKYDSPIISNHSLSQPYFDDKKTSLNGYSTKEIIKPLII
jgi:hypothetical protein